MTHASQHCMKWLLVLETPHQNTECQLQGCHDSLSIPLLNAFIRGKKKKKRYLSEWKRSRPVRTELSQGIFCPGKPENSLFLWFGQKKKKSWNLQRGASGAWKNRFQMLQDFVTGILSEPRLRLLATAEEKNLDRLSCWSGHAKSNHAWKTAETLAGWVHNPLLML